MDYNKIIYFLYKPISQKCTEYEQEMIDFAIEIIEEQRDKEKKEKEEGCDWCRGYEKTPIATFIHHGIKFERKCDYCPMCGNKIRRY